LWRAAQKRRAKEKYGAREKKKEKEKEKKKTRGGWGERPLPPSLPSRRL